MASPMSDYCGYPLEWFVQPVDELFKCDICCHVMKDPTSTQCGHIYCAGCISSWVRAYHSCPERCREAEEEVGKLRPSPRLARLISGLVVQCQNKTAGCRAQPILAEKQHHEHACPFRPAKNLKLFSSVGLSSSQEDRLFGASCQGNHKRTNSSGVLQTSSSKVRSLAKRSPSSAAAFCRYSSPKHRAMPVAMNPKGSSYSTLVFKLKRTRAKEPLGLVLVSGEKTADGRPTSFHVKKVHPDTLGWKAGVQAGDNIVQVDGRDLTSISPPEAVARIKEKTSVTLTVQRGHAGSASGGGGEHVYDEIFYSDLSQQSQHSSQQDENTPINMATFPRPRARMPASGTMDDSQRYYRQPSAPLSPAPPPPTAAQPHPHHHHHHRSGARPAHRGAGPVSHHAHHPHNNKPPQGMEKGSKDSGLSSGSSTHQEGGGAPDSDKHAFLQGGKSHHRRVGSQGSQGSHSGSSQWVEQCSNDRCRIEGGYEVEDIYLQKNGTSQLGITLGYDTKSHNGQLVVCEVLANGLAAQNGHLKNGDIVRRVNGFEVHDPEEAVLLFLEQDQDITLTVARPLKVSTAHSWGPPPYPPPPPIDSFPDNISVTSSNSSSTCNPIPEEDRTYAVLDAPRGAGSETHFRRVDSCGSLDSRRPRRSPVPPAAGGEPYEHPLSSHQLSQDSGSDKMMRRTKSASSSSKPARRREFFKSHSPPVLGRQPSPLVTDSHQPVYHVLQQPGSPQEQQASGQPQGVTQDPVYHVLQQPGSPQQVTSPPPPVYDALQAPPEGSSPQHAQKQQQKQPTYHVLQQADNAVSPQYQVLEQQPDNSVQTAFNSVQTAFQHEEFKSLSLTRNRKNGAKQQQRRAASTTPHHKHLIDTSSEVPPSPGTKPSPHNTFRSISNEVSHRRCDTAPLQSLV